MNKVPEESLLRATLDSERREVRVKAILATIFVLMLLGSAFAYFRLGLI